MFKYKIVLIRHGESKWNKQNRFTGWTDIDLSEKGILESKKAGNILKNNGFIFDRAYTSVLKRSIHTLWNILDEINQQWIPVEKSWRLNERHYGALQGLNKEEIAIKYGDHQVKQWRRGFNITPPEITKEDSRYPKNDIRYAKLNINEIPVSESLYDTLKRVIPYWNNNIKPFIIKNESIIISAHGNSLRAIVKYLDNLSESEIIEVNIPTAIPLIYEFNTEMKVINSYYLNK